MTDKDAAADDIFAQTLRLLEQNDAYRNQLYGRVSERVTMSIRFGLLILLIIAISIYLLLNTLNSQVSRMLEGVAAMNQSFDQVDVDMRRVREDLHAIEQQTRYMQAIELNTGDIAATMLSINQTLQDAGQSIRNIRLGMQYVDQSMQQANYNLYPLNTNMWGISRDMERVSEPFDSFERFLP